MASATEVRFPLWSEEDTTLDVEVEAPWYCGLHVLHTTFASVYVFVVPEAR